MRSSLKCPFAEQSMQRSPSISLFRSDTVAGHCPVWPKIETVVTRRGRNWCSRGSTRSDGPQTALPPRQCDFARAGCRRPPCISPRVCRRFSSSSLSPRFSPPESSRPPSWQELGVGLRKSQASPTRRRFASALATKMPNPALPPALRRPTQWNAINHRPDYKPCGRRLRGGSRLPHTADDTRRIS